jgi:hypothetical protein
MADQKITQLTAYTLPASTDVVPIVDVTNSATKKIAVSDLAGDWAVFTGTTVTSTTLVDLAGMSIPLTAGTWVFEMLLSGASSSTAGVKFGVQYSGTATSVNATFSGQTSTTAFGATARITALNTGSTTVGTTANAQITGWIFGQIVVTTSGNLTAQALKVTSGTLTMNASSWMRAYRVA